MTLFSRFFTSSKLDLYTTTRRVIPPTAILERMFFWWKMEMCRVGSSFASLLLLLLRRYLFFSSSHQVLLFYFDEDGTRCQFIIIYNFQEDCSSTLYYLIGRVRTNKGRTKYFSRWKCIKCVTKEEWRCRIRWKILDRIFCKTGLGESKYVPYTGSLFSCGPAEEIFSLTFRRHPQKSVSDG